MACKLCSTRELETGNFLRALAQGRIDIGTNIADVLLVDNAANNGKFSDFLLADLREVILSG